MGFFDDEDPFEDIVKQFFGDSSFSRQRTKKNKIIESEEDERMIDFIETNDKAFLIFELPGYRKEDIRIIVESGNIEIIARRKVSEEVPAYLAARLNNGIELKKPLPKNLKNKKYAWTFNNGILEVVFKK
jgi:HSP20 family molecular chaperone IbpA